MDSIAIAGRVVGTGGSMAAGWRLKRDRLHRQICRRDFNRKLGSLVQVFGSNRLDASALLLPIVRFLPFDDERVIGTMEMIQKKLSREGLIYRYMATTRDHFESAFVACSFWMVQNLKGAGRKVEAERLFERLLVLRNDVGLLSEEYDPGRKTFMGNFPQALSHIALINAARALAT